MRQAMVYFHGRLAGMLREEDNGQFTYAYDPRYLIDGEPIAFSIPLSADSYRWDELPPFFSGLVSEGWLRQLQAQYQHVDEQDSFGLLLANGRDLVGAVSVLPIREP
ncbi:HipA N-terminal domain-containing protein [Saccharospirillum sp.]|uniref:HipA N-terminal domain-containing protein n=1 Tax=Saccharospirillum sp. TaxID=2033801 RepID=UPI0034A01EB8